MGPYFCKQINPWSRHFPRSYRHGQFAGTVQPVQPGKMEGCSIFCEKPFMPAKFSPPVLRANGNGWGTFFSARASSFEGRHCFYLKRRGRRAARKKKGLEKKSCLEIAAERHKGRKAPNQTCIWLCCTRLVNPLLNKCNFWWFKLRFKLVKGSRVINPLVEVKC